MITNLLASFAELKAWAVALPDQTVGRPTVISDAGEPYVEIFHYAFARPSDADFIEGVVASRMATDLHSYFEGAGAYSTARKGRIYWRIPIETIREPMEVLVRYDENGPDVDRLVDRRCVADKDWIGVKAYCRLYRATHPIELGFGHKVQAAE